MAPPEMERYLGIRMTPQRARVALLQSSLFVSCRRDFWANLIANCDAVPIRRRLMEHEYEELVEDEYSPKGHYDLIVRQGELMGLTPADFERAKPLRTSMATWKNGSKPDSRCLEGRDESFSSGDFRLQALEGFRR